MVEEVEEALPTGRTETQSLSPKNTSSELRFSVSAQNRQAEAQTLSATYHQNLYLRANWTVLAGTVVFTERPNPGANS